MNSQQGLYNKLQHYEREMKLLPLWDNVNLAKQTTVAESLAICRIAMSCLTEYGFNAEEVHERVKER
jgi:hypothetical protein